MGELAAFVEGVVERSDDDLFEFGTAESVGEFGDCGDLEIFGVAFSLFKVNGDDLFAFGEVGEVNEEDFVEAAFAEEFGGEGGDIVGGGDDEDGFGFFLHPAEEGAEDAGGGAAVADA